MYNIFYFNIVFSTYFKFSKSIDLSGYVISQHLIGRILYWRLQLCKAINGPLLSNTIIKQDIHAVYNNDIETSFKRKVIISNNLGGIDSNVKKEKKYK